MPQTVDYSGPVFMRGAGGMCVILHDEGLVGDDETAQVPPPEYPGDEAPAEACSAWVRARLEHTSWVINRHFSNYYTRDKNLPDPLHRYISIPYLACITLGSARWAPHDWRCEHKDLTAAGKALCTQLYSLYGNTAKLLLQTRQDA